MDFLGSQIFWYIWRQPLKSPTNTWGIDVDLCSWLLQNMWNGDLNADFQTGRHIQKKHPFIIDGSREYKVQSFLRFQEQLRVRKDGNRRWDKELNGIVYIYTTCTQNGSQGSG